MAIKFKQLCRGKIIGTGDVHLEELIPVDTNEPTTYVRKWDCGKTENDKVRAYLTGASGNYTLHIYGVGDMMDFPTYEKAMWTEYGVKHFIAHDGITSIGNFTMSGNRNGGSLASVTLSPTVRTIGVGAFSTANTVMTSLSIGNGVRHIKNTAFAGLHNLAAVSVSTSVKRIDNNVFKNVPWYTKQTTNPVIVGDGVLLKDNMTTPNRIVPDDVKFISGLDPTATYNRSITSLTLPTCLYGVGRFAMVYMTSLTSLTLPDSLKWAGTACLRGYAGTTINIPPHLKRIPSRMLLESTNLSHIFIPATVEEIWSWEHGDNYAEVGAFANGAPFYNTNENLHIYCERAEKPSGWDDYWDYVSTTQRATVHWGVSKAAYDAQVNEGGE